MCADSACTHVCGAWGTTVASLPSLHLYLSAVGLVDHGLPGVHGKAPSLSEKSNKQS